jgi:hypothetical protein
MKSRKKVIVDCNGPIVINNKYTSPWEDLIIRFKTGPGKNHSYWLTVTSKKDLENSIEFHKELHTQYPDLGYDEWIKNDEEVLNHLKTNDFFCDEKDGEIYTSNYFINKYEAERMMNYFMSLKGFKNIKYIWKRPTFVIIPT